MKADTQSGPSLITYEDYCLIPDDGKRYEVIDGVLYMSPSPLFRHQHTLKRLLLLLDQHAVATNAGVVIPAPFDVVLSDHNVVQPDILFIAKDRLSILTERNVRGAPDLVAEILSEGHRRHDEIVKHKLYERYGVNEYWIVDPELERITVYRFRDGRFVRAAEASMEADEALETPLLPGFRTRPSELFSVRAV